MVQYRKRNYNKEKRSLDYWILSWAKKMKCVEYLGGKCLHCGEDRIQCLSFHHVRGQKEREISKLIREKSWDSIKEELDKCILLCENCHRKEHEEKNKETKNKSVKKIITSLKGNSCEICGYNDCISSLDFHHLNPEEKEFKISDIRNINENLLNELDKCIMICSNCHLNEHFDDEKFKKYENIIKNKSKNLKKVKPIVDRKKILKLHDEGLKQSEISKKLDCSPAVICQVLKEHLNFYVPRIDDEMVSRLYLEGMNPYRISKIVGFSRTSVVRSLKRTKTI